MFDEAQGCTILSGDVIIRHLAEQLKPEYVVFIVSFGNERKFSFKIFFHAFVVDTCMNIH